MLTDQKTSTISVIIPTLNEAENLEATLSGLIDLPGVEVIVVDCGSSDGTVDIAKSFGVQIISGRSGRANQMNVGAQAANGEILLFLHADTILPLGFEQLIRQAMTDKNAIAGAFHLSIKARGIGVRFIEKMANYRAKYLQMPYGDQALFVSSKVFEEMGGFPDIPLMEDFAFVRKLRKKGCLKILPPAVVTSGRRWKKLGVFRTTCTNQIIILGYLLGLSPKRLYRWYRNR